MGSLPWAGTRLAKVGAPFDELSLVARLAAAHRRPIETSPLRHIQRALAAKHQGDARLACMHMALSGLAKFADPREDARWLFMIDTLLDLGADPLTIARGLGTDPAACGLSLEKYSPDQPRVPAGNPDGGHWTSGNAEGDASAARPARAKVVQVADASPNWAQYVNPDVESSRSGADIAASSRSTILQPRASNFVTEVNISCEELAESDLAIRRSADRLYLTTTRSFTGSA